jgi:arginase family enzyme
LIFNTLSVLNIDSAGLSKKHVFTLRRSKKSEFSYESGRLNLPFVGFCTFAKAPICEDWDNIKADVAVLGVPNDMGGQYRSGSRFGPRAIREASTLFSFGHGGAYDHEDDRTYLTREQVTIVDIGDADIIHTDQIQSHANTEEAVRKILSAGAMPLILGGDHSITSPVLKSYDRHGPIHGGFLYYEVLEFLAGLAEHGDVKGMDLVEVSPPYDHTGVTSILAAQILMNAVGRIFYK